MIKHVLVPLDGSVIAERALDVVKRVLSPGGTITLLSAISSAETMPIVQLQATGDVPLDRYLEHIALRMRLEGFEVKTAIQVGDPAEVIAEAAIPLGIDIIAICSHGRAGLERMLAGSVTDKLLTITPCPVLVIPLRIPERSDEAERKAGKRTDPKPGLAPE